MAPLNFLPGLSPDIPSLPEDHIYVKRQVPKIDGSAGVFIGLVVGLGVIILVCCIAVFILLRNHVPSTQGRDMRRLRSHRQHQSIPSQSTYTYNPSSGEPPSWKVKLGNMFGMGRENDGLRSGPGNRKGPAGERGWMQAGSGDDWDPDVPYDSESRGVPPAATELRDTPLSQPRSPGSTVTFEEPSPTGLTIDPYAPSFIHNHPTTRTQLSLSSASSGSPPTIATPLRAMSPEPIHEQHGADPEFTVDREGRKWSLQSGVSRTHDNGTRFIEAL